jgi:hypothetical protein
VSFGPASFLGSVEIRIRPVVPYKHPACAKCRTGPNAQQRGWVG